VAHITSPLMPTVPSRTNASRCAAVLSWLLRRATLLIAATVAIVLWAGDLPRETWFSRSHAPSDSGRTKDSGWNWTARTTQEKGWPHRRGPHWNAVSDEDGLADSWPDEGPPVLWIREIGNGYSGFSVIGHRAFTQTQSLTEQKVVCLNADTGETIWEYAYAWPYEAAGMYPGPRATPTWHAGRVYFLGARGLLGCLDDNDGRLLWSVDLVEKFDSRGLDFGHAASPTLIDGKVLVPVGGKGASVVALDARDGSTIWKAGDAPASYCSAMPIVFGGQRYVVVFLKNSLAMHELESGRLVWERRFSHGYDEHSAAILYDDPYVLVTCPFRRGATCYRLEERHTENPSTRCPTSPLSAMPHDISVVETWSSRILSNDTASSVLFDGNAYGFDLRDIQAKAQRPSRGTFKCINLKTGDIRWETEDPRKAKGRVKEPGHASVIVVDGKLVLFNDRDTVLLANASPDIYHELARASVFPGEICWTAPALHRKRLYLRSPTRAACLYLGRPEELDLEEQARSRPTSTLIHRKQLDLAGLLGGEREYLFDPADVTELTHWYGWSVFAVLVAGALAYAIDRILAHAGGLAAISGRNTVAHLLFWEIAFMAALVVAPIVNRLVAGFVFTWPTCLFVVHQVTLCTIVSTNEKQRSWRTQLVTTGATLLFLTACLVYFLACRQLSMALEWTFLLGFIPSWPIAVPAAYQLRGCRSLAKHLLWGLASFTAFFWSAGGMILWRAATM